MNAKFSRCILVKNEGKCFKRESERYTLTARPLYPLRGAGATANGLSHRRLPVSRSTVLVVTALMSKAVALAEIGVSKEYMRLNTIPL